jgi:nitric oxide reductase NorQ protein
MWEINCGLQTTSFDLFGRYVGLGKENWVDGQIVSWCRNGGILYLDEANMMKQDVATRLNPLLDTRGHIVLNEKDNEIIPRHPLGFVVISMNPFSIEFAGTKPLNAAFRRRMNAWITFDYLSTGPTINKDEVALIRERCRVSKKIAAQMVAAAAQLRFSYKKGDIPYAPSVGDIANWATLVADGTGVLDAAEETIISTTSDDPTTQELVRRIIRSATGTGTGAAGGQPRLEAARDA